MDKPDLPWAENAWKSLPGEGWWTIIADLDHDLREIVPDYQVVQVKEKFGGLRYYTDALHVDEATSAQVNQLIRRAEWYASLTCEECGHIGTLRSGSWYRTLCDADNVVWQERRARMLAEMENEEE